MRIEDLVKELNLVVLTGENQLSNEANGVYICDLLSWVMSHAQRQNVWITVQANINIVAIASLLDLGCIIIPENIQVDEVTLNRANEKDVVILSSQLNSFDLSIKLYQLMK